MPDPGRSWRPFFRVGPEAVVDCFQEALKKRRRLSGPDRQLLEAHLQDTGVRQSRAGKIPDEQVAKGLADLCSRDKDIGNEIIPIVIRLWMESKSDLRTRVEQSLRANNLAIRTVTSASHGFEVDWPPDSYREITDQLHAENRNEPSATVDLMICCLTGRAPVVSEESAHEFQMTPVEIDFDEWLSTLRGVPETSKLWDAYARFAETAAGIHATKRRLAILAPLFREFRAEADTMQRLFGYSDCESWAESDFDFLLVEQVAGDMRTMIARLHVLKRPLSSSYDEQISQFEERKTAGQIVAEIYSRLSALRNQTSANTRTATPRQPHPEAIAAQVVPDPGMPQIGAELSCESPSVTSQNSVSRQNFRNGVGSPAGRTTNTWNPRRPVSNEQREVTAGLRDAPGLHNQPAVQKTGPGAAARYPQKSGAAPDTLTKTTKSVATWQRWEKTALDRKFMIVISILGIFCLGTTIAIVAITHRILAQRRNTVAASPVVEDTPSARVATVTLKRDGSRFSGTVVRRENDSITMMDPGGFVRTFLESDVSDIRYSARNTQPASSGVSGRKPVSGTAGKPGAATALSLADQVIEFAKGAEFPIRSVGFLDSSSVPAGAIFVGVTDADIKSTAGRILIPEGANVTFGLLDNKKIDGRISMSFQLESADFNGHHYVISPATGKPGPAITVAFTGAKEGSPEAIARGLNVHLDDQSYMEFRAAIPVAFRLSDR